MNTLTTKLFDRLLIQRSIFTLTYQSISFLGGLRVALKVATHQHPQRIKLSHLLASPLVILKGVQWCLEGVAAG